MIHRGMRDMMIETVGDAEWIALERELGIGPAEHVSLALYDDELTISIIATAADRLGLPLAECLRQFGQYWIRFAARGTYGSIMNFAGRDLVTFIGNLDRMHQAVLAAMPEAQLPAFAILDHEPGKLLVEYRSNRTGLAPFVAGLLEGLLERFDLVGEVTEVAGGNAVRFEVAFRGG
jgi:guanylate cyclase soluble subunit beta